MENSHSKLKRKVMVFLKLWITNLDWFTELAATLNTDVNIYYVCIFKLQTCVTHFYLKLVTLFSVAVQLHIWK